LQKNQLQETTSTLLKASAFYSKDLQSSSSFDPVLVLPHPKAGERKITKAGRKRRHAAILTDTPEKRALEEENEKRKSTRKRPQTKKSQAGKKNKSTGERKLDKKKKTSNGPKKQKQQTRRMFRKIEKHPVHPLRKMTIAFVWFVVSLLVLSETRMKSGSSA
jgi:hypothetical protein